MREVLSLLKAGPLRAMPTNLAAGSGYRGHAEDREMWKMRWRAVVVASGTWERMAGIRTEADSGKGSSEKGVAKSTEAGQVAQRLVDTERIRYKSPTMSLTERKQAYADLFEK